MKQLMILILVVAAWACSKEEFESYGGERYIFFAEPSVKDSVDISFFNYPDADRVEIPVYVSFAGEMLTGNKTFKLVADEQKTTAKAENYDIPETLTFRAGFYTDTVKITLIKTNAIGDNKVRLVLKLQETADFRVGPETSLQTTILFTAKKDKPLWWTANITNNYLGEYTEAKFTEFVRATQVHDLTGMNDDNFRYYALKFKYYLQEIKDRTGSPVMDGEGEMTVPVKG